MEFDHAAVSRDIDASRFSSAKKKPAVRLHCDPLIPHWKLIRQILLIIRHKRSIKYALRCQHRPLGKQPALRRRVSTFFRYGLPYPEKNKHTDQYHKWQRLIHFLHARISFLQFTLICSLIILIKMRPFLLHLHHHSSHFTA